MPSSCRPERSRGIHARSRDWCFDTDVSRGESTGEQAGIAVQRSFVRQQRNVPDEASTKTTGTMLKKCSLGDSTHTTIGIVKSNADLLETDPVTGRRTGLAEHARRALRALRRVKVPHAVIGAAALAARGLPRMTRDLDIAVITDDAFIALDALQDAGFRSVTPINRAEEPEPMYVLRSRGGEVDLLVAAGEPEATVIVEATPARLFGTTAPVATIEHLVLMYLYSNQPRHFGDFARIVTETNVDLGKVVRYLEEIHPEMLPVLRRRVKAAKQPPPPPPRPKRR